MADVLFSDAFPHECKLKGGAGIRIPAHPLNSLRALSLFSGGGGLDIGFERAGYDHVASFDTAPQAGEVLRAARPKWDVYSGVEGDVTRIDWTSFQGAIDVLHGGPPCQPYSTAGGQHGPADPRDMLPEFTRAVLAVRPRAFVCENVRGLLSKQFASHLTETLLSPLSGDYTIRHFVLNAADFGVPQRRRRVFFIGFSSPGAGAAFRVPMPTHGKGAPLPALGARVALGLPGGDRDGPAPTIRSGLTGPRHTTSVVNSASAAREWARLGLWPNGVALTREAASAFPTKDGTVRLSVADVATLQGFPADWPFAGMAVYKALGLIGNSVAPPVAYVVAAAVADALTGAVK